MPSVEHAAFVELVRTHPEVIPVLLTDALGLALPAFDTVTVQGMAQGERRLLFVILAQRGIVLTSEQRETLESCNDTAQIELWARRALTAGSAVDLFD